MIEEIHAHERCLELVNRTGYQIIQTNGQRVYRQQFDRAKPMKGSEIFVGKLPRDLFEDEIVPLFSRIGPIHQTRLMMDFNGKTRGFCFISFYVPTHADEAVTVLNGYEIRPRKRIGVHKSIDNCRLFIGGIPTDKNREEVRKCFSNYVDGIVDVIMYPSRDNRSQNRGYAFIEFETHKDAAMARRNLSPGRLLLWDVQVFVDWAEPIPEVDPSIMAQVKKLYLRNLDPNLNAKDLCNFLTKFVPMSYISKIHKNYDYAFVHFTYRKAAEYCIDAVKGKWFGVSEIEATWARPRIYSKMNRASLPPNHFCKSTPPKWTRQITMSKTTIASASSACRFYSAKAYSNIDEKYCF